MDFEYKKYVELLRAKEKNDGKMSLPNTLDTDSLMCRALPVLGSIPLLKNDTGLYSASRMIKEMPDMLDTPNGPVASTLVKDMMWFYYLMPRSGLIRNMKKEPRFATPCPIPLYAFKIQHDIGYDKWDKSDEFIKYFIGRGMEDILAPGRKPQATSNDIKSLRSQACDDIEAWRIRQAEVKVGKDGNDEDKEKKANNVLRMYLQTWVFNVQYRNESSMILDPWDWGNVPKALDSRVATSAAKVWDF